jgi:hypothetical protein
METGICDFFAIFLGALLDLGGILAVETQLYRVYGLGKVVEQQEGVTTGCELRVASICG